jgi:hypothetical protein
MGECDGVGAVYREVAVSRGVYSARVISWFSNYWEILVLPRLLRDAVVASHAHLCYYKFRMSALNSYRRFTGGFDQERLQSGAYKANGALYANLAKPLFCKVLR